MKTLRFTSLLALLVVFAAAQTASAAEQAAAGSYQFVLSGDKYLKYVEFEARSLADGSATGFIYFTDEAVITIQDVDGTGQEKGRYAGYSLKAEVDGMAVDGSKAVLSAVIQDSSNTSFIGQRILLTVLDGEKTREPDMLTWGVYKPTDRRWVPSDAELKEDPGVGLRWWATDAERRDDVGYEMPRDESISSKSFPVISYDFVDVSDGAGDIRVIS